jgi:drug/metabolite transporter (DMT)-like permease
LLLAGLTLGWGVNWPVMKISLAEIPPWTYRSITGVIGSIGLLGAAWLARAPLKVERQERLPLIAAALLNVSIWQVSVAYGIRLMASGHAAVLAFTMPLWAVALSALVLGERPGPRRLAGLALGMAAIGLLLSGHPDALGVSPVGAGLIILGALSWAAGVVLIKQVRWTMPILSLTVWTVGLGSLPVVLLTGLIEGYHVPQASAEAWVATAFTVIGPFVLCYMAWFRIVALLPASVAAISTLMVPVVGVVSGALMLHESPGWRGLGALGLVTAALALVLIRPGADARRAGV